MFVNKYLIIISIFLQINLNKADVDLSRTKVWGPGIELPDGITLPARYFFIEPFDHLGRKLNKTTKYDIHIVGDSSIGRCRYGINQIDRDDGSAIIRYKIVETCRNVEINVKYKGEHLGASPYRVKGQVYSEQCYCPIVTVDEWLKTSNCPKDEPQIVKDLNPFKAVNFSAIRQKIFDAYNKPGSVSICNYVIKNNHIFRNCYGQYTGFKMFMDAVLLSLVRKFKMPDTEFFVNLGDWPLVKKGGHSRTTGPYPIFSWCGSDTTFDIVLPTYDITESTLENMGRVSLDMLSVQKRGVPWKEKIGKGFFRGRDSRRERLDLIDISRKHPDLINASMTNFFFFREEEKKYGPKVAHISLLDFFDYKFQITIDGTVASYRFPYLLAGSSVVFKQISPYYEHFYKKLEPNKHYIPFKRDLSDLVKKIEWAKENEESVQEIIANAHKFVEENLLPLNVYCYHALLFKEYSNNIVSSIQVLPEMDKVEQPKTAYACDCQSDLNDNRIRDEL